MTIKSLSRKQVIIHISTNNILRVIANANAHVSNINWLLKGFKSEVSVNFIYSDNKGLLLTTNKVAVSSDLNIIEKYLKDSNNIKYEEYMSSRLPQFKSYLKILSILYLVKGMNLPISSNIVESIIKSTQIFNDITLTFYSYIIKVSPKSDMAVICIDIWDFQNSFKAKILINKCFNIGIHITMIRGTNINPWVPQWNCWK